MNLVKRQLLSFSVALLAACSANPAGPELPDPRGQYRLVSVDAQPLPLPLPSTWNHGASLCSPAETGEKELAGGILTVRELFEFVLELNLLEACVPEAGPARDHPSGLLVMGQYSLRNDTLHFHVPIGRNPPEFGVLYTAPYHPQTLRLRGDEGVLEFRRIGP